MERLMNAKKIKLCNTSDLTVGDQRCFEIESGEKVAVFNVEGSFFAVQDACPHRGGPLSQGRLEGHYVSCPFHAWKFDLKTGTLATHSQIEIKVYPLQVEDGTLFLLK